MAKSDTATQEEPTAKMNHFFKVYDMNQRGKEPRKHEVIIKLEKATDGTVTGAETVSYDLYSDKACEMPMEHALKFLCDAAFKVVNTDGNRVPPVRKFDISKPITHLADDEIVCNIAELSRDSLMRRVKVLPGSEEVRGDAKQPELVAFLVSWNKAKKGLTDGERAVADMIAKGDLLADALPPDMAEKLMGRSPLLERAAA